MLATYKKAASDVAGPYSLDKAAVGSRRLRDVCLGYLASLDTPAARALCMDQLDKAVCITDALAAFIHVSSTTGPEKEKASVTFHDRVADDPLGLDKWFRAKASADVPDLLDQVKALMQLPAFHITNPNRVRAVLGAFTMLNPKHFHAEDGSGYRFAASSILELDAVNPQIAARLARAFSAWRRLDEDSAKLMRAELERIKDHPGVSRNTLEIATTSLQ